MIPNPRHVLGVVCVLCSMSTMMRFLRLGCKQHPKQQPKQPKDSLFWFVCAAPIVCLMVLKPSTARRSGRFEDHRGDDFVGHNIVEKDVDYSWESTSNKKYLSVHHMCTQPNRPERL